MVEGGWGRISSSLQLPVFETVNLNIHAKELKIVIGKQKLDYMQTKTLASAVVSGAELAYMTPQK